MTKANNNPKDNITEKQKYFKQIPKVDVLLENNNISGLISIFGQKFVVDAIREESNSLKSFIKSSQNNNKIKERLDNLVDNICFFVKNKTSLNIKKIINGTGTILHTNLGRAPLSQKHLDRANKIMAGYTNLEYNLENGQRGERYSHIEDKIKYLTGAEAAMVVNNNAAAVMLVLNTFARNKEVLVSRGELVEIGGSFRVPDVMSASGAKLIEVGTTNKTHSSDYENVITKNTAMLLKVHTSNYKIVGFSENVSLKELHKLGCQYNVPVFEDLGSGVLIDLSKYGLDKEPTVQNSVREGIDLVSFSGDKLLGGPQAGIIVGKKKYIDKIKKNPVTRALRVDKFTISVLDAVITEYFNENTVTQNIPILHKLTKELKEVKKDAEKLYKLLQNISNKCKLSIVESKVQAGGGSLPGLEIPSYAIAIEPKKMSINELEQGFRNAEIPIIGRIWHDKFLLDLRTLDKSDYSTIKDELEIIL